mgnify:CR=1 FL=1
MIYDDKDQTAQDFYEVEEDSIDDNHSYHPTYLDINNVKQIKTITSNDIKRSLVILFIEENNMYKIKIYKYYYEYSATHLDILTEAYKCSKQIIYMKQIYFHLVALVQMPLFYQFLLIII